MYNSYGIDVEYFQKELRHLLDTLDNRTPEELKRYLITLSEIVPEEWYETI